MNIVLQKIKHMKFRWKLFFSYLFLIFILSFSYTTIFYYKTEEVVFAELRKDLLNQAGLSKMVIEHQLDLMPAQQL